MSFFLAIEGADGSGTTTQTKAVSQRLRKLGYTVHETREPSTGPIGVLIREHLKTGSSVDPKTLALLFAADRLEHLDREVLPSLSRGEICISDRYSLSSFAYQALDCDLEWVIHINSQARWPDLCVLLDVDETVGSSRRASRGGDAERFETSELQQRIIQNYRTLIGRFQVSCVDGSQAVSKVTDDILQVCMDRGM